MDKPITAQTKRVYHKVKVGNTFAINIEPRRTYNWKGDLIGTSMGGAVAWVESEENADELVKILNETEEREITEKQPFRIFVLGRYGFATFYTDNRTAADKILNDAMEDKDTCCVAIYERVPTGPLAAMNWSLKQYSDGVY